MAHIVYTTWKKCHQFKIRWRIPTPPSPSTCIMNAALLKSLPYEASWNIDGSVTCTLNLLGYSLFLESFRYAFFFKQILPETLQPYPQSIQSIHINS